MEKVLCNNCKHYQGDYKCEAFKDKIPSEIFTGNNNHEEPLESQGNNIVYEPTEEAKNIFSKLLSK